MPKKTATQKTFEPAEASTRLKARLARMFDLEAEIERLDKILRWPHYEGSQKSPGVKYELQTATMNLREVRGQLSYAKQTLENERQRGERHMNSELRPEFKKAEDDFQAKTQEFERAERQVARLKEKHDALRTELDAAKAELAELKKGCGVEEALSFQQSLAEAKERLPELKGLVEEQEWLIREAKATIPSAEQLLERREDILAGLSTGDATEGQLNAIGKEIEALNSQIAAASAKASEIIAKAEPTLSGLRRKLADTERELEKLTLQKPDVARLILKSQAALVYSDYVKLGEQLGEKFVQMMSLNALICSVPERRHVDHSILLSAFQMKIPRFKVGLDAEAPSMSTVFSAVEQRIDLAREEEKARLKAEGITLLD